MNVNSDSRTDSYLSLAQAAHLLPGNPHPSAVWRWGRTGVMTHSGERVHLRVARLGRRLFTKEEWLDEFGRKCAELDAGKWAESKPADSPEHRAAVDELARRGVIA